MEPSTPFLRGHADLKTCEGLQFGYSQFLELCNQVELRSCVSTQEPIKIREVELPQSFSRRSQDGRKKNSTTPLLRG